MLIAETGGQNAMFVDSSALPEQVVLDSVHSAFNSAGQRCSALRVLCVQEDIADRVVELLRHEDAGRARDDDSPVGGGERKCPRGHFFAMISKVVTGTPPGNERS